MSEKMIQTGGVEICTETFGNPSDPAVLLIMGATASMLWWPEAFCRMLADRGRFVIRYDNRDTGRSTTYAPGTLNYTLDDMADDALGVLDAYGLSRAHVVGVSLGGIIGQLLAMRNPDRLLTLTVMSSTPYQTEETLPGMDEGFLAYQMGAVNLDWSDRAAVIEHQVGGWRMLTGSGHAFDDATIRGIAEMEFDRSHNLLSMNNHALMETVPLPERQLGEIRVPTLVIHGTDDLILPYAHGQAIAAAIPGARLLTLTGTGHEVHRDDWPTLTDAIVHHTH